MLLRIEKTLLALALLAAPVLSARAAAPPPAVFDLTVGAIVSTGLGASSMSVTLTWTAPGDGDGGNIAGGFFSIRYATTPITGDAQFDNASYALDIATAATAGALQSATINFLDAAATHYFVLKSTDAEPLTSALSNAATAQGYRLEQADSFAGAQGAAWGDYDGDGDLDLAIAQNGNEYVLRNGGGIFVRVDLAGSGGNSTTLAWGDYDNDGDLDLAVANSAGGDETILRNDGGGTFSVVALAGTGGNSTGIAWGDFDGDGKLDLGVTNDGAEDYLATNNGDGTFSTFTITGTGGSSQGIAWGDYDGDGDLDAAVASYGSADFIIRNEGFGVFSTFTITATADNSLSLSWADYDLDGDLDLAVAVDLGADNFILRNDGGGLFTKAALTGSAGNSRGIAWADYDADGDPDLVVSNVATEPVYLLINNGGAFEKRVLPKTAGASRGVSWGDYDGDGDLDLAVADSTEFVYLLRSDTQTVNSPPSAPSSGFAARFSEFSAGASSGILTLEWAPGSDPETADADGLEYFVRLGTTTAGSSTTYSLPGLFGWDGYCGAGSGLYSTRGSTVPGRRGLRAVLFKETTAYWAVTTVDGGFRRSPASSEQVTPLVAPAAVADLSAATVSTGLGASSMTVTLAWTAPASFSGEYDVRYSTVSALTDFDAYAQVPSENRITIATTAVGGQAQSHAISYLAARTTHYFAITQKTAMGVRSALSNSATAQSSAYLIAGSGGQSGDIAWGDFDGDGDVDLAVVNTGNEANYLLRNDGGVLGVKITLANGDLNSQSLNWADYDNDGDLDFGVANDSNQADYFMRNDGGNLNNKVLSGGSGFSSSFAWGDYDNDGDLDAAIAVNTASPLAYLLRNDGGSFSVVNLPGSAVTLGAAWGDYDQDGDLDLAFTSDGDAFLFRNDGGAFTTTVPLTGSGASAGVAWGDFDLDGDLDLALGKSGAATVIWWNASGVLGAPTALPDAGSGGFLTVGDYDNDGDLDIAVTGSGAGDEVLLANNGDGTFAAPVLLQGTGGNSRSLSFGDYDDDGDLDLSIANTSGEDVFIVRNDTPTANAAPSAPSSGFSAVFEEYSVSATSGVVSFMWDPAADNGFSTATLKYFVRVGTNNVAGSSITMKIPDRFSPAGGYSGSAYLYSTHLSSAQRGLKLVLQKETTAHWAAATEDAGSRRSGESSEQVTYLIAPGKIGDLAAAVVSTGLGASSMTVTLSWTAPSSFSGEYDIRYSTVSPISDFNAYASVPAENRVALATAAAGGQGQSYAIPYLAARTTHYFAITQKTAVGVRSALSNGAAAQSYLLRIPASSSNTLAVAWGDMDRDGDLDLAAANGTGQKETVYRRNPDGTYSSLDAGALTTDSADVAWGDLDNDGDLDFITANSGVQDEIVFRNNGNGTFTPEAVTASAGDSFGIALGDLDNDGDLDFAVANNSAEDNYIALNDGSGGFSTFTLTGSGGASNKAALGDYDNDGDLDIAFANGVGQNVVLAENQGGGVFSTSAVAGSGGDSVSLAWGDYDADGNLDLAVGNLSTEIYLLKGDGSGGFSKVVISGSAGDAWGLAWGDIDNDGDLDLVAAQDGGGELFLYNDGAGNFSAARTADTGNVEFSVSLGDADGDGDLDVGVGVADNDNFVIRNDTVAAHTPPSPPPAFSAVYSEFGIEASSGALTLMWQNASDAETTNPNLLSYFVRVGTAVAGSSTTLKFPDRFSASASADGGGLYSTRASTAAGWRGIRLTMQKEATAYWSVMTLDSEFSRSAASPEQTTPLVAPAAAADLTVSAIVSTGPAASTMTAVLTWTSPGDDGASGNILGGEFDIRYSTLAPILSLAEYAAVAPAFRIIVSSSMNAGALQTHAIADLNAYATHYFAITIKDALGIRSGLSNPATAQAFLKPVAGSNGFQRGAAWGDMDGDGDLDFVVAGDGTNTEWVFTNNGDGTFTQNGTGSAGNSLAVAVGDFDNDGDLDIAVANRLTGDEVILRNDGGGTYTDISALTGSLGDSSALAWGDYDNDGDLDLAVANISSQDEYIATNNGDGTFSTFTIAGSGGNSTGIAWGDYDNDGDLDLAVANDNGADSKIFRNDGSGNFASTSLLAATGGASQSIAWFDFNGDGWLDVAIAQNSSVDILKNNSGASFSLQATVATEGSAAQGVVIGDFDGDGDPDLATHGGNPHLITNKGDGTFSVAKIFLPSATGVSWGDMDGDGDLDLLVTRIGDPVTWLLRNDTPAARSAPTAPAAGFSASFAENGLFLSTGVLTLRWDAGSDAQTPALGLEYRVRIGTGATNSSTTVKIPLPYGLDSVSGGGSFLYSTRLADGERGIRLAAQKEATYYWTASAEDSEFLRSAQSAIQTANLSAPAKVTNLTAAIDTTVQTSSLAWIALSFNAPGEDGSVGPLQAGSFFDIRWSTSGIIDTQSKYAAAPYQALFSAAGTSPGVSTSRSVAVENPNKTHYFALTTLDRHGVRSALSNAPAGVLPRILREETANIASTSVLQDKTTGFLRIKVWTDGGNIRWNGLKVKRLGTLPDAAIKTVGIWDDSANGNQTFDAADIGNRKTSDAVFVSSRATLTFTTPPTITNSTQAFFLGVEFDANFLPVEGATAALALDGEAFIVQQGAVGSVDFPALGLDGVDDGVRAGADNSLNISDFTLEAWIKTTDSGSDRVIISRGDATTGTRLWLNGSGCGAGVPTFYVGSAFLCANAGGTPALVNDGEWHHVAAAFNSINGKKIFIDGVGLSTGPFTGTPANVTEGIAVGVPSQPTGLGSNLAGAIDEVRVSNFSTRYSTAAEFIPAKRFLDNEGNTVLLYHFDGSLDGAYDSAAEVKDDSNLSNTNKGVLLGSGAGYGRSTFTAVIDIQDVLAAAGTDIAPGTMFRNQKDIGMLRLDLWTQGDNATLERFFVTPIGQGSGAENLTFYLDDGDKIFKPADDASILGGVNFFVGTATFDLGGIGAEQLIDATTKTYFIAWDMGASASLNLGLGLQIEATANFTLSGSTDIVFNSGYPIQTSLSQIVGAEVFVTPEIATGIWVNVSSIVFRSDFSLGNVNHYHYRWDRNPATNVGGADAVWSVGKNTVTATVDADDWYFHVRAFAVDPTSGTQVDFGPYFVDTAPPAGSAFRTYNSTGGLLAQTQFSDLAVGVTAQFFVQDSTSGLNFDGPAPAAPDSGTVSLWYFDEQSGADWRDASGPGRNDLNIGAGAMTRMQGRFKTGLLFNGASHLIDPAPIGLPVGNAPRSFEAWIFPLSTSSTRGLASWGNTVGRMRIALQSGQLAADMGGGYVARGPVVSTGVWQHAAFTFDGSLGRYYLDGVEVGSNAFGAQATVAGGIFIGDTDAAGTKYLGGMDDVRIMARAPSAGEVQEAYSRGDPYYVSYSTDAGNTWRFIASTGTSLSERVELSAAHGSLAQETIKVYGMDLVVSTYTQTGAAATNQVRFHVADAAGNVLTAGPFAVLVDTNAPVAISTPALPLSGAYVRSNGTKPNFHWVGPTPPLVSGMKGSFLLQVDENDSSFAAPVIFISTPALAPDNTISGVNASYISTFTLNAGSTYYWRVRARSSLGVDGPWSQTASFVTDVTTPAVSAYRVKNSSGGLFLETENVDLLSGVTAQIVIEDAPSGPAGLSYYAQYPSTPDVIGYWDFSETGGGNPLDVSGNGNNGTLSCGTISCSSATYAVTPLGSGMKCSGGQGMTAPNADFKLPAGSAFTIEAWIYPQTVSSIRVIAGMGTPLSAGRNYTMSIVSGDLQFNSDGGSFTGTDDSIKLNEWQHVAMAVEGTKVTFYVNGAFDSSGNAASGNGDSENMLFSVCAGINPAGVWSGFFGGLIDEVRVIGRALDAKQIAADYAATAAGRFAVEYSTTAGQNWNVISATVPSGGFPYLAVSGNAGSTGQETLEVRNLSLTHSTSSLTGSQGTNQLRFTVADRAGNLLASSPFTVLVDTVAAASAATPIFPVNGGFAGARPTFNWVGPSTTTIPQLGAGAAYWLEADTDGTFVSPAIRISTPVITQSTLTAVVNGAYVSTYTLTDDTTYYWRVRTRNSLGLFSQALTIHTFVTDFDAPLQSGFVTYNSTGGAVGETIVNDLASGVTAEIRIQDAFPNSGLSTQPVSGVETFGVVYSTLGGANPQFWVDGGWGASFSDPAQTAVESMAVFQGELYVGTRGGGSGLVYKFTGVGWNPVGGALPGSSVKALEVFNNKLYAGLDGDGRIYSWNGAGPWALEFNTGESRTNDLAVYNGRLYAATASSAKIWGHDPATGKWFLAFDSPINPINALEVYKGSLYAAGQGGVYVSSGATFSVSNGINANFFALKTFNNKLYAGSNLGGNVYSYDGTSWAVDFNPSESETVAFGLHDGRLYVGANAPSPGRIYANDGKDWLLVQQLPSAGDKTLVFSHYAGRLYTGTQLASAGTVFVSTPLAVTLTGVEGSTGQETLRAEVMNLAQSASQSICNGVSGCTATNQVRFTAADRAGNVRAAGPYAVLVDSLLSQPAAFFPAPSTFVRAANPTFVWKETTPQPTHDIQLSQNADMSAPLFTQNTPNGVLQSPLALAGNTTYYWRVRSINSLGIATAYTAANNFIVDLQAPSLISYRHVNSTAGAIGETQINNLSSGAAVRLSLQDPMAGLLKSTSTVAGEQQAAGGGFGVMYSTDAGYTWRVHQSSSLSRDGAQENILSLAVFNGRLYAGQGSGSDDGDVFVYDGTGWSATPAVPSAASVEAINALAVYQGKLYAGQGSDVGDGDVLEFNGAWSTSYDGAANNIHALAVYNGDLYAGAGGPSAGDGDIHMFNGASWSLSTGTAESAIRSLAVYGGRLYAGGGAEGLRIFDGKNWNTDPSASPDPVLSLAVYDGALFAGTGGGDIRKFDGSGWSSSFTGSQEEIASLAVFDGKLYAGQGADAAGDGDVYVFDGQIWRRAYDGAAERVGALAAFDGRLYAGLGASAGAGDIVRFSPVSGQALSGNDGSTNIEILSADLDLVTSTSAAVCAGTAPCAATNQVLFTALDRAGNLARQGPYAVLVDTFVATPAIGSLTPLTTRAVYVTAVATDNLAGLQDYLFEASTSASFAQPVTASAFVSVDSYTFTNLLVATTYYFRVTTRDNLLNVSTPSVAQSTSTFGTVLYSSAAAVPASALQNTIVPMLRMHLYTPAGTSKFLTLTARLTGSAADQDVSQAQVYRDANGNGVFDAGSETFLAGAAFSGGTAFIPLGGNAQNLSVQISTFFVAYQMSAFAQVSNTVGLDLQVAGDIGLQHPDSAQGPFPTVVPPIAVTDGPNEVTFDPEGVPVSAQNAAPGTFNILVKRLDATTPIGTSLIDEMVVHMTGDLDASKVTRINVWRDRGTPGVFDPLNTQNEDKLTDQGQVFTSLGAGLAVSTVTLSAPTSSRTVVQGGGEFFFITVDLSATAEQGKGFQLHIATTADIHLNNPADTVTFTTATILTSTVTAQINNIVTVSTRALLSAAFLQGQTYAVLAATMTTDVGTAQISRIKVNLNGSAGDSDIAAVAIFKDKDADGPPFLGSGVDIRLGSTTFTGGQASIDIAPPLQITQSTTVVYVVYSIAPSATGGNTAGAVITDAGDITPADPTTSIQGGPFPIQTTLTPIQETVNTLLIPAAPAVNPPNLKQGTTNAAMLSFQLQSSNNNITWSSLTLDRLGDAADADVDAVRIYRTSVTASNQLSGKVSTDVFTGGSVTVALDQAEVITSTASSYIVALDISPDAVAGSSIAVRVATTSAVSIDAPNVVSSETVPFPIITPIYVPIQQFDNTVLISSLSIVPALGALPGALNVGVMRIKLNTNVSTAKLQSLKVERVGSSVNSDISSVKVYFDKTGAGVWNASNLGAYDLITSTTQTFGSSGPNDVVLNFSTPPVLYPASNPNGQKSFFLVVDVSTTATPDNTVIIRANNETFFQVDNPNRMDAGAKFTAQTLTIAAPPSLMYVAGSDVSPAQVTQGATGVSMMRLRLWMENYSSQWSKMTVSRLGSGSDADISGIRIFDDGGSTPGVFDAGDLELTAAAGIFSGGVASLSFSTQTITTSTKTYHIVFDVDVAAQGASVGVQINNSGDLPLAAPHVTSNLGFPLATTPSAILKTQTGMQVLGFPRAPGQIFQEDADVPIISLQLNTTQFAVLFTGLTVRSTGTAQDADITAVNLWYDANNNNSFEAGTDQRLTAGTERFVGGLASLTILPGSEQTIETTQKNYFVTVDVAQFADDAKSFGVVVESSAAFIVSSPNFVVNANFPAPSSPPISSIKKINEVLNLVPGDVSPAGGINQSTESVMMRLDVSASREDVEWTRLRIDKLGNLAISSITSVRLYRSSGAAFVPAPFLLVASGTFIAAQAEMIFVSSETIGISTNTYFVSVEIDAGARVDDTVGLKLSGSGSLTVTKGDSVSNANLPLNTGLVKILDVRTPTKPAVTLADGAFSNNFEYMEFSWATTIGVGQLVGAFYAIGTTPGGNDVFPGGADPAVFAAIGAGETNVKAKGFALISGNTYYVSVKAQSQAAPEPAIYMSPVGISAPVLVDFTVPPAPAPNISQAGKTLLFTWGTVTGGPSGIRGYLIEYRTGAVPIWKNAKTNAASVVQTAGFATHAAVPAADVVTGNSFQLASLPAGTVYVRMRSVSGAGQAGPPSGETKLLLGAGLAEGITDVSNYPNPFDSRKQKTTIHFTLGEAGEVTISIYSIYGRMVKSLGVAGQRGSNEVVWDGTDEGGRKVSKGIYLCVIQAGGEKIIQKIGVIH